MNTCTHARLLSLCCALALAPAVASAGGARTGVEARPGEMVLLRDVNARHAYRPAPPSVAVIVDPTPNREIHQTLGTGELSDEDFAAIDSGNRMQFARPGATTVERVTANAVGGSLGAVVADSNGLTSGGGINGALSVPLGTVGTTTRGIGNQVGGALSQFPLGAAPGGNGGP